MTCPKCKSENVNVQAVTETKTKGHGALYWLLIGWWWWMIDIIIWVFAFIPRLIWRAGSKSKVTSTTHTEAICQQCGHRWRT